MRVLGLGFGEVTGAEKEFSPVKSSWGPTVGHFPWDPGQIPSMYHTSFFFFSLYLFVFFPRYGSSTSRKKYVLDLHFYWGVIS